MLKKLLLLASCLCAAHASAFDTTTQATVIVSYVTSQLTSTPFERKLVLSAHDDAAAFIASSGELRGARLEAALGYLRVNKPKLHASDLELAEAILVQ